MRTNEDGLELIAFLHGKKVRYVLPSDGEVSLGRSEQNGIRLMHHSVSRHHVILHCQGGEVSVEDVGSRNGTRVFLGQRGANQGTVGDETHGSLNEWRVKEGERRSLAPGDMIRLGSVMVRLQKPSAVLDGQLGDDQEIVEAPATRKAYELAARVADSKLSVLILGETGVGKDVLAHSIHRHSSRRDGPFVRLHCAALAENLLESELFGHVKGAFTGAVQPKLGLVEAANGGTLFLDELGEMPLSTQVKLLNVLETSEVTRVGGTRPVKVDVRFISATNRDLPQWVREGKFRRDLYFRVNGMSIELPPLRNRTQDIEPLARRFLIAAAQRAGREAPELPPACVDHLLSWYWPGNVRELRNVMERAVLLASGSELQVDDLVVDNAGPASLEDFDDEDELTKVSVPPTVDRSRTPAFRGAGPAEKSREMVEEALQRCSGNQTRAAEWLGVSRRTLVNWLDEFDIPRPRKR